MTTDDPGPPDDPAARDGDAVDRLLDLYQQRDLANLPKLEVITEVDPPTGQQPGDQIGRYKLLQHIADGGMGEVWMAEQHQPIQRQVALKIIKVGMDTREVIARFEAERNALALMDHPHIAHIFDGGATEEGRPYFVMELVQGVPITEYCDKAKLDTRSRLALFITVCEAVQHAHQRGIIHRDLKPGNILVANQDGHPFAKVIDFGIAKATEQRLTERTLFTEYGRIVGTFAYMGPEQAEFTVEDVDTRTDIYSLGCLLYELLTGAPPFEEAELRKLAFDQVCQTIRETDPAKPSARLSTLGEEKLTAVAERRHTGPKRLRKAIRGELDWIVMKALEKDRNRRYQTASEFGQDLTRHLEDRPVDASPPSASYRLNKFARRNKRALAAAAAIALTLMIGTTVSTWQAIVATVAKADALTALGEKEEARAAEFTSRKKAEETLDRAYAIGSVMAHRDLQAGRVEAVRAHLEAHTPTNGETDRRGWEWYYLLAQANQYERSLSAGQGPLNSVCYSPSGKLVASAGESGDIAIWDAESWERKFLLDGHDGPVSALAWHPESDDLIASASHDHTAAIWRIKENSAMFLRGHGGPVRSINWHPDESLIATAGDDKTLIIWNGANGKQIHAFEPGEGKVVAASWSRDGAWLSCALDDPDNKGGMVIYMSPSRFDTSLAFTEQRRIPLGGVGATSIAWSADSQRVAATSEARLYVWNIGDSTQVLGGIAHDNPAHSLAWHPEDAHVATAANDQTVRLWDTKERNLERIFLGHTGEVNSVTWSPDGARLVSTGADGTIKMWIPSSEFATKQFHEVGNWISSISWSPDGSKFAIAYWDRRVAILEGTTGVLLGEITGHNGKVPSVAWSPSGDRIATASYDDTVRIWDSNTLQQISLLQHGESMGGVIWSPDEMRVACQSWAFNHRTGGDDLKMTLWDLSGPHPRRQLVIESPDPNSDEYEEIHGFAWHPDGALFVTGNRSGALMVWDAHSCQMLRVVERGIPDAPLQGLMGLSWSPDGKHLAFGQLNGRLAVCEKVSNKLDFKLLFERIDDTTPILRLAWSPDGKRFAVSRRDGFVVVHDSASGAELLKLDRGTRARNSEPESVLRWGETSGSTPMLNAFGLAWSPDGRRLASGGNDGKVIVWDAGRGYDLTTVQRGNRLPSLGSSVVHSDAEGKKVLTWLWNRALMPPPRRTELKDCLARIDDQIPDHSQLPFLLASRILLLDELGKLGEIPQDELDETLNSLLPVGYDSLSIPALNAYLKLLRETGEGTKAAALLGIRPRPPGLPPRLLDLTAHYNASPYHRYSWVRGHNMAMEFIGEEVAQSSSRRYDIRGIIQLNGGSYPEESPLKGRDLNAFEGTDYPDQVQIQVDQSAETLFLLGACCWGKAGSGEVVAMVEFQYADGSTTERPLESHRHWGEWYIGKELPLSNIVWRGAEPFVLYEIPLDNPHPEKLISTINLVSAKAASSPFILAITLE